MSRLLLAFAGYCALTVVYTFPLVTRLSRVVPNDPGDPLLNTWILWWNAHHIPLTADWWNAPSFYPASGTLAFTDQLLSVSLIASPVQWLGGSPQLAYNIAFLLSFALSALGAHALVYSLTRRHDAAAIAGLAFGFAPYRVAQLPHLQMLTSYWMPLTLLALHRYIEHGRRRWVAIAATAWALQALSSGYYLIYFSLLVAGWVLWFGTAAPYRRRLVGIAGAFGAASLALLPLLLEFRRIHQSYGLRRGIGEIEGFSADISALWSTAPLLRLWGRLLPTRLPENELFPGLTVVALVAVGAVIAIRSTPSSVSRRSVVRTVLAVAGLLFLGIALSVALAGPWAIGPSGFSVSAGQIHKPLSIAALCLFAFAATSTRARALWDRRSAFAFYVIATAGLWLLAFGPSPKLVGTQVLYKAPYGWLLLLPGFDGLRVPARLAMPAILCLSIAAGFAYARIASSKRRWNAALLLGLSAAIVAESWLRRMPLPAVPPPLPMVNRLPANAAVLEWPIGDTYRDVAAMFRTIYHGRPVVNGFSGYFAPHYAPLHVGLARFDATLLRELATIGPIGIVVDQFAPGGKEFAEALRAQPGIERLAVSGRRDLFLLRLANRAPNPAPGKPVGIANLRTNLYYQRPGELTDGDVETIWFGSDPQSGSEEIVAELSAETTVGAVTLSLGPHVLAFPRQLVIETSPDGMSWQGAWQGPTSGPTMRAALDHPKEVPVVFRFEGRAARFVRLRQVDKDPKSSWAVAELSIHEP